MRVERHQHRERITTTLIDGETPNARRHHALKKGRLIVSDLLPSGSQQRASEDELNAQRAVRGSRLGGAKVVFVAHEEEYKKADEDGVIRTYKHGVDDGLENRVLQEDLPSLGGNWLEGGSKFQGLKPGRRDSIVTPMFDRTYK